MLKRKVLLCILDGWGIAEKKSFNAISEADKKNFDNINKIMALLSLMRQRRK